MVDFIFFFFFAGLSFSNSCKILQENFFFEKTGLYKLKKISININLNKKLSILYFTKYFF
ncbi:MAG: hypothetical protein CL572_03795 [Alphaproteobacteria bacterium]|nr:hypothetical protein [Alphaproteobacteria bacterium]